MNGDPMNIVRRAQVELLQDPTGLRWPAQELVAWLNEGQRLVAVAQPAAVATEIAFTPAPGDRQELPEDGFLLLDVLRNDSGRQRAVTKVDRKLLDAAEPGWVSRTPTIETKHYMYPSQDLRVFNLYPPAAVGAQLKIVYARHPTPVDAPATATWDSVTGTTGLNARWDTPLLNYVLYRAYSKDAEYGANTALAASYLSLFSGATNPPAPS